MKLIAMIILMTLLLLPCAFAKPHSNLHEALDALHRAQTTIAPEDIHTAQHCLEAAVEFAKGQRKPVDWGLSKRKDALAQVVEASKALDAKDRVKTANFIEQALKLTNEAIIA